MKSNNGKIVDTADSTYRSIWFSDRSDLDPSRVSARYEELFQRFVERCGYDQIEHYSLDELKSSMYQRLDVHATPMFQIGGDTYIFARIRVGEQFFTAAKLLDVSVIHAMESPKWKWNDR